MRGLGGDIGRGLRAYLRLGFRFSVLLRACTRLFAIRSVLGLALFFGVGILDLLAPVQFEQYRHLGLRQFCRHLPGLRAAGDGNAQTVLFGQLEPAADVTDRVRAAQEAPFAAQEFPRGFEFWIEGRPPIGLAGGVACKSLFLPTGIEKKLPQLRVIAHEGARIAPAARAEFCCGKDLRGHDAFPQTGFAQGHHGAQTAQDLARGAGVQGGKTLVAIALSCALFDGEGVHDAKARSQSLAIRPSHVDVHIGVNLGVHVRRRLALANFEAAGGVGVDKSRQGQSPIALDHQDARRRLFAFREDAFDAPISKNDSHPRRIRVAGEPHIDNGCGLGVANILCAEGCCEAERHDEKSDRGGTECHGLWDRKGSKEKSGPHSLRSRNEKRRTISSNARGGTPMRIEQGQRRGYRPRDHLGRKGARAGSRRAARNSERRASLSRGKLPASAK